GGTGLPRPGAVSLAHRGVLFMDECPEFSVGALEALRQPLERGSVLVSRSRATVRFPARFQLVLAANPCPCARVGDAACTCAPSARRRYLARLSGPLLDRIDLQVWLTAVSRAELLSDLPSAESTAVVARRVADARGAAAERWGGQWSTNADVPGTELRSRWRLPTEVTRPAERALERGVLSARGFDRVLRISWTLADLSGRARPDVGDVAEAVGMRSRRAA
ncbi:MAG TPA: ATP-binding protein, partial [Mycobacteriales bacterium]